MTEPRPAFPARHDPRLPPHRASPRAQARRRGALGRRAPTRPTLEATAADLRRATRERLAELGLGRTDSSIPESFSYYDQVLDAAVAVGALPERFADLRDDGRLDRPRRATSPPRAARARTRRSR